MEGSARQSYYSLVSASWEHYGPGFILHTFKSQPSFQRAELKYEPHFNSEFCSLVSVRMLKSVGVVDGLGISAYLWVSSGPL